MRSDALRSAGRRIAVMRALVVLLFFGLAARAAHLTVIDPRGDRRHDVQVNTTLAIRGARGAILDREGRELAVTVPTHSIYAMARDLGSDDVPRLAEALGVSPQGLDRRLRGRTGFTYLARWVDDARAERVSALSLPAVGSVVEARRRYPAGSLAGPVLGFADIDGDGVRGIEQQEDAWLRGQEQRFDVQRDGRGRLLSVGAVDPFEAQGGEVKLTLDLAAQAAAERALHAAVERSGAKGGMVLTLVPQTGEILALAEAPGFDPNRFREVAYDRTGSAAFLEAVEPGSTLKIFAAAAALESGAADETTPLDCSGAVLELPGGARVRDRRDFGVLTMADTLRVSSNIGSALLAQAVGRKAHYETLRRFGFGQRTGREGHFPSESAGLLRPWSQWQPIDHATISFGQGVSVTAVQLASATAALANDGVWVEPRLVAARRQAGGRWKTPRASERQRAVSPATAKRVLAMMESVVSADGTGRLASLRGLRVAGKTGTAQKFDREAGRYSNERYIAWFVGVAPADDPRLAVVVALDEPRDVHSGGALAAPLFAQVTARQLARFGIATDALKPTRIAAEGAADATSDSEESVDPGLPAGDEARTLALGETVASQPAPTRDDAPPASPTPRESEGAEPGALAESDAPGGDDRLVGVGVRSNPDSTRRESDGATPARVLVPEFVGMTLARARTLGSAEGLSIEPSAPGGPKSIASDEAAIAQWPVPGTILEAGERGVILRFEGTADRAAGDSRGSRLARRGDH